MGREIGEEIVYFIRETLEEMGWKIRRTMHSKKDKWYGCYLKQLPQGVKDLLVGVTYQGEGKSVFIAITPSTNRAMMKLITGGFRLSPLWDLWFYKNVASYKNIKRLRLDDKKGTIRVIKVLLESSYPFSE